MINSEEYAKLLMNAVQPGSMPVYSESMQALDAYVQKHFPNYLYRFRNCNENSISAFWKDELWLSSAKYMNDDFDARIYYREKELYEWLHNLYLDEDFLQHFQDQLLKHSIVHPNFFVINNFSEVVRKAAEVIRDFRPNHHDYVSKVQRDVVKFACFTESITSDLMWGHYANNASGFALSYHFNGNRFETTLGNNESIKGYGDCFPVLYSEKRLDATEHMKCLMLIKYFDDMLQIYNLKISPEQRHQVIQSNDTFMFEKTSLIKSTEWKAEREWRLFGTTDSVQETIANNIVFKLKPAQLFLGRRISELNEKILLDIAAEKGIPVFKMFIQEDSPDYKLFYRQIR